MSKHRTVNTHFWDDAYIETLNPNELLLFLYLITNPQTNIAGIYEITIKRMHEQTRLPKAKIEDILAKFEADGRFIYKDNVILAVNAIGHQKTDVPTIKKGIEQIVSKAPQWVKDRVCIDYEFLSHLIISYSIQSNSIQSSRTEPEKPKTDDIELSIHCGAVLAGIAEELGIKKLSVSQQRDWATHATLAFENGFTAAEFVECFAALSKRHSYPILPKYVTDQLPNMARKPKSARKVTGPTQSEAIAAEQSRITAMALEGIQ